MNKYNMESYFQPIAKKLKSDLQEASKNCKSQITNSSNLKKVPNLSQASFVNNSTLTIPERSNCENDSEFKISSNLNLVSPLKWNKISAENLNLEYVKLFPYSVADKIFQRLESEVEYFTGDLLKVQIFGKWHQIPRKQVSYGDPGLSYKFSGNCIPALEWTPLMLELKDIVEGVTCQEFNFVLVNRYKDGADYMGEHRDDEKDLVPNAPIASLSFGQARDFIFRHKDSRGSKATRKIDPVKLVLEHGSLLIMNSPTNDCWYHSLPVRKKAINPRVNLTFRKMVNKKKIT